MTPLGDVGTTGIRGDAKHSAEHRTAPTTKSWLVQHVGLAKLRNAAPEPRRLIHAASLFKY